MSIQFACPRCNKRYSVKDTAAGKAAKCACGEQITVPHAAPLVATASVFGPPASPSGPAALPPFTAPTPAGPVPPPLPAAMPPYPPQMYPPPGGMPGYPPPMPYPPPAMARRPMPQPRDVVAGTFASNPGHVGVNPIKYSRHHPWFTIPGLVLLVAVCYLGVTRSSKAHPGWGFAAFGAAVVYFGYWLRKGVKFDKGCVNPAVVISGNPWTIAVYADLSTGGPVVPYIKIIQVNLSGMAGGPPQVGMRLGTVAMYSGNPQSSSWSDFSPEVVNFATTDPKVIARVLDSIPADEWAMLDTCLGRLQTRQPGLHRF